MAELSADTDTPLSAFLKLTQGSHRFLFESVEGGERWGRYSFLGSEPSWILSAKDQQIEILQGKKCSKFLANPLEVIEDFLAQFKPVQVEGLPRFSGGLVGYFGYDIIRHIEHLPRPQNKTSKFPDIQLALFENVAVYDNLAQVIKLIVQVRTDTDCSLKKSYELGVKRLQLLLKRYQQSLAKVPTLETKSIRHFKLNITQPHYEAAVKQAQEYIRSGDIFQVVLAQCMTAKKRLNSVAVYRKLRQINPSPYLFCLQMGENSLVGSSPELMVRLEQGKVTVRPIAGTRRRGRDVAHDLAMEREMLNDPKEKAEHIMLVDLARNDIGRVAKVGSVHVTEQMKVERYSHVMHLVSNVEGQVKEDLGPMDVLKATFPAGTLTGAPKIRAMEIIDQLEPTARGPYGGCVGYLDFFGNMDTAITIRTIAMHRDEVNVQAGAGVVLDSIPEREFLECQNKAKAMITALG